MTFMRTTPFYGRAEAVWMMDTCSSQFAGEIVRSLGKKSYHPVYNEHFSGPKSNLLQRF
jgi:hypothetical protein